VNAPAVVGIARFFWLVLTFMMLVSRGVFQAAGAEWMRSFLDGWKVGRTRQVWGVVSLALAMVALAAVRTPSDLRVSDWLVLVLLVLVLVADGLVNVLPSGFHTFKDRVQTLWVRRHQGTDRVGDRSLFGVGNLVLAVLAGGWSAVVISYRPINVTTIAWSIATAIVLTPSLILLARLEGKRRTKLIAIDA
jgi:hypothetical protein